MPDGPLSPLSAAILTALLRGPLHGYGIIKTVEADSGGALRPGAGSLYAALDRLAQEGLLAEKVGATRRRFAVTARGRAALRAELERVARLTRIAAQHGLRAEET